MNCKVVFNTDSGNCCQVDFDKLLCNLGCRQCQMQAINSNSVWDATGFQKIVVCGGDGTLCNALNLCPKDATIVYVPCGTLNEGAKKQRHIATVGKVNDSFFGYVCATGSFTPIGYTAKAQAKQRHKRWAYFREVAKHYRCHNVDATLKVDDKTYGGNYTLLMVLKSSRCFGFDFNKCYNKRQGLYLLAIKAVGKNCLANKIKMFFPFFRVFFGKVRKPTIAKNWMLLPFCQLSVTLNEPQPFCIDGEKRVLGGTLHFDEHRLTHPIEVIAPPKLKGRKKFNTAKQKANHRN